MFESYLSSVNCKLFSQIPLLFFFSGEERSFTADRTKSWEKTHLTIVSRCELKDIFDTDEFGLFSQQLSRKTLHLKRELCAGRELSKFCLTGLAAGNTDSKKLSLFIIGKSEMLSCFKGI